MLYVLGGLFATFFIVSLCNVRLFFSFTDNKAECFVKLLFFKVSLLGGPEKKVKERKKKKKKKESKKKKEDKKGIFDFSSYSFDDWASLLKKVLSFFWKQAKRFSKLLHVDLLELKLKIAGSDAANTAIVYGAACGAVSNLIVLLETMFNMHEKRIDVAPVFTDEKTALSFKLWLRIRILSLMVLSWFLIIFSIKLFLKLWFLKIKNRKAKKNLIKKGGVCYERSSI